MIGGSIDELERRAAVLEVRAALQRTAIRRSVIARMTEPQSLVTAAAFGALVGWRPTRAQGPQRSHHRRGGVMRMLSLAYRYSGTILSLVAWLMPAFVENAGRPRPQTPR